MMDAQELYERMQKIQEAKGYYFNKDKERTFELLEALITNKKRTATWAAPADCSPEIEMPTGTLFAHVFTACPISRNWAVAIATSTFQENGMRAKFRASMFLNGGRRKK